MTGNWCVETSRLHSYKRKENLHDKYIRGPNKWLWFHPYCGMIAKVQVQDQSNFRLTALEMDLENSFIQEDFELPGHCPLDHLAKKSERRNCLAVFNSKESIEDI